MSFNVWKDRAIYKWKAKNSRTVYYIQKKTICLWFWEVQFHQFKRKELVNTLKRKRKEKGERFVTENV